MKHHGSWLAPLVAIGALCAGATQSLASPYDQTDLVSDIPGLAAVTDPALKNPWGMSETATSPFWISNQGTNTSTLYSISGSTNVSKVNINPPSGFVAIPTTAAGPQGPTGQTSNSNTSSFPVGNGGNGQFARFIFANLNGTISAWDTGPSAFIQVTTPGALYTGLATDAAQTRLYAANGAGTGGINVFNSSFAPVSLSGGFIDPNLPADYVPFNVSDINGKVYVTYAPKGRDNQTGAVAGQGVVDVFDENGNLLQRLITGSELAAPWGIALAQPASVFLAATCWLATSASEKARSTHSIRYRVHLRAQFQSVSGRIHQVASGASVLGTAEVAEIGTPSISATVSMVNKMGFLVPLPWQSQNLRPSC